MAALSCQFTYSWQWHKWIHLPSVFSSFLGMLAANWSNNFSVQGSKSILMIHILTLLLVIYLSTQASSGEVPVLANCNSQLTTQLFLPHAPVSLKTSMCLFSQSMSPPSSQLQSDFNFQPNDGSCNSMRLGKKTYLNLIEPGGVKGWWWVNFTYLSYLSIPCPRIKKPRVPMEDFTSRFNLVNLTATITSVYPLFLFHVWLHNFF